MSRMWQQVKQKQQRKRGQEKEDPAGSFHNEGHPLVCVCFCVCASVFINKSIGKKQAEKQVEEKGKARQTERIKDGFTLTFQQMWDSGYAALRHDALTADLNLFFFYTQCA